MLNKVFKKILNIIPRPWLIRMSLWSRPILDWYYKGNNYIDPINGKSYRKFLPYGYGKIRENVLSPGTLSLERHRLLWLYLKNHSDFFKKPISLLHVAPEQSFYKIFRQTHTIQYTTTDLYSPLADVKADICHLPFADNTFDWILCNHVLEHITDDALAMKELYRVLKKGGCAIMQVPQDINRKHTFEDHNITDKKTRAKIFGQYDHVRIYGLDYFEKLKSVGFNVEIFDINHHLTKAEIAKYSIDDKELLPVCYK